MFVLERALSLVLGFALGYVTVSVIESLLHKHIYHASGLARGFWNAPFLGVRMKRAWYSHHVIHHCSTFRTSYVAQFEREEEQISLSKRLTTMGRADIVQAQFGSTIGSLRGLVRYISPFVPFVAIELFFLPLWPAVGVLVAFALLPTMAQVVHPYVHGRDSNVAGAPVIVRLLLQSRYGTALRIRHWLHHEDPSCNFSLLLGGDEILGASRRASKEQVEVFNRLVRG